MSNLPEVPGCTVAADSYGLRVTHISSGDSEMVENDAQALTAGQTLEILAKHRVELAEPARALPGYDLYHRQWAAVWKGRLPDEQVNQLVPDPPEYSITCWPTPDRGDDGKALWTITLWGESEEMLGTLCAAWLAKVATVTGTAGPA
ncbi:hypothetical protein OHA25_33385 [Nonomuraea sp. NBC_00507]|uniref:hypothetical protein n=1 Tax=Nonomuraea sp. NBC_00507 TaxID=2976002 RepID=UPI002E19F6A4